MNNTCFLPKYAYFQPLRKMASGEIEDGPRVLGIGVGLFLLILLWSFTLLVILVFTRVNSVSAILLTSFSVIISG